MHIPDGFLSTPVWASLGAISFPTVGVLARRAQTSENGNRAPLLGVLGAFVFAAQMINFPIAAGTSSHLLGGALLACSLGPAAGVVVMTAVLAIQALVFQDGGLLALGANVFNLAIAGVLSAYLPYYFFGSGRFRKHAIFAGAVLSVGVSGFLALSQILLSGVPVATPLLRLSAGLFAVSAIVEGFITIAVVSAIERINPDWVKQPEIGKNRALTALGGVSIVLACAGFAIASGRPDALETVAAHLGLASRELLQSPLAQYHFSSAGSDALAKGAAGLIGLVVVYFACLWLGRLAERRGSA
jgi:cobalt/nickel transport system permease protein